MQTHRIHVWFICLRLVDFYGKCMYITISYMDPMGNTVGNLEDRFASVFPLFQRLKKTFGAPRHEDFQALNDFKNHFQL